MVVENLNTIIIANNKDTERYGADAFKNMSARGSRSARKAAVSLAAKPTPQAPSKHN